MSGEVQRQVAVHARIGQTCVVLNGVVTDLDEVVGFGSQVGCRVDRQGAGAPAGDQRAAVHIKRFHGLARGLVPQLNVAVALDHGFAELQRDVVAQIGGQHKVVVGRRAPQQGGGLGVDRDAVLHQQLRFGRRVLVNGVLGRAVADCAHVGPCAAVGRQGHRVVAAAVDHHLVETRGRGQRRAAVQVGPGLAVRTGAANANLVEPGHVVDVFVRNLEHVGRCVGGHVDALNAFDAAGFVDAHGRSVADFEQVQVGTATQANRVKTRSRAHGRLGRLARAVVLQVGDVAGREHDGVIAFAGKEAVHTAATGDGVVAGGADQSFAAGCAREGTCTVQRRRHPLRAAQHHVVAA